MTQPTETAPAFDSVWTQVQSFFTEILALDPQQAALRAGLTLLVVIGAALLIWGLHVLFKAATERLAPAEEGAGAPPKSRVRLSRWSLRIARLAIFVIAILIVLRLWGVDFEAFRDGPLRALLSIAGRIALIVILALAAIELSQLAITQMFARVAQRAKNPRRAAQVRTLAPLLTGVATTTLAIVAAMMALSEVGVEIGPLIAGAGIIGLAIGFGAQTLVKDFLTGIFLIIEDIVSVGDVIRIGEFSGRVEEMSLRTIKLRDFDGTLHVFPYSEAQVIHNSTKTFSYAVLEPAISYMSDINAALEIVKRIGDDMREEPAFAGIIIAPMEIAGVDRFADTRVILKARIKTAPGKQWLVQRELLRRLKLAFDDAGIELAPVTAKPVRADEAPSAPGV
ncbi:MAG: mechanosensitive ion channel family protein [Hyphomonadaceae bacterium]